MNKEKGHNIYISSYEMEDLDLDFEMKTEHFSK